MRLSSQSYLTLLKCWSYHRSQTIAIFHLQQIEYHIGSLTPRLHTLCLTFSLLWSSFGKPDVQACPPVSYARNIVVALLPPQHASLFCLSFTETCSLLKLIICDWISSLSSAFVACFNIFCCWSLFRLPFFVDKDRSSTNHYCLCLYFRPLTPSWIFCPQGVAHYLDPPSALETGQTHYYTTWTNY